MDGGGFSGAPAGCTLRIRFFLAIFTRGALPGAVVTRGSSSR